MRPNACAMRATGCRTTTRSDDVNAIVKRSISIRGHRTSFSLEKPFLDELATIAELSGMSLARLVEEIDAARPRDTNLSSQLRLHVLEHLCARLRASEGLTSRSDD